MRKVDKALYWGVVKALSLEINLGMANKNNGQSDTWC